MLAEYTTVRPHLEASVRGYPHDLTRRARLRAEAKQKADLWPSQVIIALRLTDIPWSSRTIPRTLTSAISYSEIIPFWGMIVTQKSSFTNRHLKHSDARKSWDICSFITTYRQIPNDRSAFFLATDLTAEPVPLLTPWPNSKGTRTNEYLSAFYAHH